MPVITAALVAAAVLCWGAARPWRRLRRTPPRQRAEKVLRLGVGLTAALVVLVAVGGVLAGARGAVLAFAAGASAALLCWTAGQARQSHHRRQLRDEVASGCSEVAAALRAGHPPRRALGAVARHLPVFAQPAAQLAIGGDAVEALRRAARRPGAEGLAALAAAWSIAERTGASMTTSLDDVAADLVAERELGRAVATELAAARLTGRLLGLLPLAGIGLGYLVGGDPVGYLTSSPPGLACLGIGVGLAVVGVVWSEKLADRAAALR